MLKDVGEDDGDGRSAWDAETELEEEYDEEVGAGVSRRPRYTIMLDKAEGEAFEQSESDSRQGGSVGICHACTQWFTEVSGLGID
jgi:hypothetical protein